MSTSNTNDAIDKFVKQTQIAKDYNSKEVRISIQDAEQLVFGITLLLNSNTNMMQKVMELQDRLLQQQSVQPRNMDLNGGSFR